jgi:hypothetical protein
VTERRSARGSGRRAARALPAPDGLPAELVCGPNMEDWSDDGLGYGINAHHSAEINWKAAMAEWASRNGWSLEAARGLARTTRSWSRHELRRVNRGDWIDFLEGRRPDHAEGSAPRFWQLVPG